MEFLLLPKGKSLKATKEVGKKTLELGRVFYRGKVMSWLASQGKGLAL